MRRTKGRVAILNNIGDSGSPWAIEEEAWKEDIVLPFMNILTFGLSRSD